MDGTLLLSEYRIIQYIYQFPSLPTIPAHPLDVPLCALRRGQHRHGLHGWLRHVLLSSSYGQRWRGRAVRISSSEDTHGMCDQVGIYLGLCELDGDDDDVDASDGADEAADPFVEDDDVAATRRSFAFPRPSLAAPEAVIPHLPKLPKT